MSKWYAIFDWDGVIVDSSKQHERSWEMLSNETGYPLPPDHFARSFGMRNEVIIPELYNWTQDREEIRRLSLRKEELYRECVQHDGMATLPGVREWLGQLRAASIPSVIGSSTHRLNIECALDVLGLSASFSGIISSEDVERGKPDPDVFLKAAALMRVPPSACVVFEDTAVGIEAALAAGMVAVGVATTHEAQVLKKAHRIVDRMDQLQVEELLKLNQLIT